MSDLGLPLGVIALPAIAPLIALIQLLFPGLLGEQWKQYRAAIGVLLSQSTLMTAQWLATFFVDPDASWWLGPQALAWGLALVAIIGFSASLFIPRTAADAAPARIEFLALQGLALASIVWLAWQRLGGSSIVDQMLVVAAACVGGIVHLLLRQSWSKSNRRPAFATESIFLLIMAAGCIAVAQFVFADVASHGQLAAAGEALIYRCDNQRSGSRDMSDSGPGRPGIAGDSFATSVRGGRAILESTPLVVEGKLVIGARHEVQANNGGILFGTAIGPDGHLSPYESWRFGDQTTRAIFSSPVLDKGYLYFGEGYHQHAKCRLFCIDAADGRLAWSFRAKSHVESPPAIVGEQIYFGAGDDGIYCLNLPQQKGQPPSVAWHYETIHADASPLIVENKLFVGGVVGDVVAELKVVALDRASGTKVWERAAELPIPAAVSYSEGSIYLGLGNGKLSGEATQPRGKVWSLSAATGEPQWEFALASSVLTSPVVFDGRVHFVARNGECYALDAASGERLWKYECGEDVVASPIISGGRMFVVTLHGFIDCLDVQSGTRNWRFEGLRDASANVYASPVLSQGRLYVAIGGKVHCVGDADSP